MPNKRRLHQPRNHAAKSLFADPYRLALFTLVVLTLSRLHQHYGIIGMFHPGMLCILIAVLYAIAHPKTIALKNLTRAWPPKVIAGLGVVACFSVIFGISMGNSGTFMIHMYSKVLLLCILLIISVRHAIDLRRLVWAFVLGTGILVWLSLFVIGISKTQDGYTYDANGIGLIVVVAVPLTLLCYRASRGMWKIFCAILLVGLGQTVATSESRGAFLGLLIVGICLFFTARSVSMVKRIVAVAVLGIALAIGAPSGYWDSMRTLTNPTEDYNWTARDGRKKVAKRGLNYMWTHPLFGVGIHNFTRAECMISEKAENNIPGTGIRCTAAHNSHIQIAAELGIPGLVLWLTLLFGGIAGLRRLRRRLPEWWLHADPERRFIYLACDYLAIALLAFAITSTFLSFAYLDPVYLLAAMLTGVFVCAERLLRSGQMQTRRAISSGRARERRRTGRGGWRGKNSRVASANVQPVGTNMP